MKPMVGINLHFKISAPFFWKPVKVNHMHPYIDMSYLATKIFSINVNCLRKAQRPVKYLN